MAYRDEIDDAFDAAVFLEERYLFILLIQKFWNFLNPLKFYLSDFTKKATRKAFTMEKSKVCKMEDSWVYRKGVKLAARFVLGVIINQLIVLKFYKKKNTHLELCVFTVTPSKIKMQTSRWRKPRIWEMK